MVLTSSQTIIRPSFFTHEAAPRSTPEPADKAASEIYMNSPKILSWTVEWSKASNEGSQKKFVSLAGKKNELGRTEMGTLAEAN